MFLTGTDASLQPHPSNQQQVHYTGENNFTLGPWPVPGEPNAFYGVSSISYDAAINILKNREILIKDREIAQQQQQQQHDTTLALNSMSIASTGARRSRSSRFTSAIS